MRIFFRIFNAWTIAVVSLLLFISNGYTQQTVLLTESFEAGTGSIPPPGWVVEQVTGSTPGLSFVNSSTYPTVSAAFDGTKFVSYNSFNISACSSRLKDTIAMSTMGKSFVMVEFAWHEDPGYSTYADKVEVQWSTNGVLWTTAGTFNRYNAVAGWKMKNLVLPATLNNQPEIFVGFLFTSAYGNNCSLDKVRVTAGPLATPALVTIGTGTTAIGWPYYTFYMGSRTQMLYTAAQLTVAGASAGNLTSVGFNIATAAAQTMTNFTIKMGHTTNPTLTGWVTAGMSTVYQVNYAVAGTGWRDINLTTPFAWNGTSNVIVEICFGDNGSYTTNTTVLGTAATGTTWHYHGDNYAGCTGTAAGAAQTATPNIRFGGPPIPPGALMGYVKDANTLLPIAGAIVVAGTKRDTTKANGSYMIYNLSPGIVTAGATAPFFAAGSGSTTIVSGQPASLDILLLPGPRVGGIVTDAMTGAPIVGASVTVAGIYQTMSVGGGAYLTPTMSVQGAQTIMVGKTGYDDYAATVTLVPNTTTTRDAALLPIAYQPGTVTATLNLPPPGSTAVNLNWTPPKGMYQLIYDDGIQDKFAIWATSGNLNALKFSPTGYPATLYGGSVNLGSALNYPSGALPLTPFIMLAMNADGVGGVPGTIIDSVIVTPTGFGWADFSFSTPLTINSGDFYLVMKQQGTPPNVAGLAVDTSSTAFRSYSNFVTGGASWVPATGNFMIRALMYGTGGPLMADNAPLGISYQVWRLRQGDENNAALWTSIYSGASTTTVDNGWPMLADGPYRWAVKSIYSPPGQRFSPPAFSNVIGKNWTAPVTVCAGLSCSAFSSAGTTVRLINSVYPDTNYTQTTNEQGCATFPNVWKGNYHLRVYRTMYLPLVQTISVMGPQTIPVSLLQDRKPATNLSVNENSLMASWSAPKAIVYAFDEQFTSGSFATNQWTVTGGTNWQITSSIGNPAPSARFNFDPRVSNYDQYFTSKTMEGTHMPQMKLKYDIYLDNFNTTYLNSMAVELWDGINWTTLKAYDNMGGNIPWTTETFDISSQTHNPAFQIRFHASGADSYDIDSWYIDNIQVYSDEPGAGEAPCVVGYHFYLDNVQLTTTPDTNFTIPPGYVVYGQTHITCVEVAYALGTSPLACVSFISHYLYPPQNLVITHSVNTANLSWQAPAVPAGLTGYNIYRDGKKLNLLPVTTLSFEDIGVPNGPHSYLVRAEYLIDIAVESLPAGPVTITIEGIPSAPVTFAGQISSLDNAMVTVPVKVNDFNGITAFSLRLDYDPTVLTFTGFSSGSPQLAGLSVENYPVSPTLSKLIFFWSGTTPQSLPDGANLIDLYFHYHTGYTILTWNNDDNSGFDCEFADISGEAMLDFPTGSYYNNGWVEGIPEQLFLNYYVIYDGQDFCFNAQQIINVAGNGTYFLIENGGRATMAAGQRVSLHPGTYVAHGGYLLAYIANEGNYCGVNLPAKGMTSDLEKSTISGNHGDEFFRIYPNPVSDHVTLQFNPEVEKSKALVRIYNLLGEEVFNQSVTIQERLTFSVRDLPGGLYFVNVIQGKRSGTEKIVKE